ncbi:MAG: hypothetical protein M1820_006309 [Bogoriella megaspora]|nr:MAG: hypothetical protein M1820_006309 [Bogoriella megaspora]
MPSITHITSSSHFSTQLTSNVYVIADFYADWCGPCKAIAPVFEQLASAEGKPGKLSFVKIDVDAQQDIARQYGVAAMPTFLILKNGSVKNTIRGANPSALRAAVSSAAADAKNAAPKSSQVFQSKGHTLGSSSSSNSRMVTPSATQGLSDGYNAFLRTLRTGASGGVSSGGWVETLTRALGLYLTSLFALDAGKAAEASPFSVKNKGR